MSVIRVIGFLLLIMLLSKQAPAISNDKTTDEPALKQAKQLINDGDFNTARDICEAYLKRTPSSPEAQEMLEKTRIQLKKLSDESFYHGLELEHMNNFTEAKQFLKKAILYLRPGDENYQVVKTMLEKYND